jgi:hypothetical protein
MALSSELVCVPDPRACANKLDPLQEMLPLCIRAIASGTDRRDGIAELGRGKLGWLRGSFPFAAGARSEVCLGWAMTRLPRRARLRAEINDLSRQAVLRAVITIGEPCGGADAVPRRRPWL